MFPHGYVIYQHKSLDSTNAEALRLLRKNEIHGNSVIVTEEQTAGRGRNGKVWLSPKGNLYMSIVLEKSCNTKSISQLVFVTAVAVGVSLPNVRYKYKWPNDILLSSKKVSGILLENHGNNYIIIGIGINVGNAPDEGMYLNKNYNFTVDGLLKSIVTNFANKNKQWSDGGFETIRKEWLARVWNLNKILRANISGQRIRGKFLDVDSSGRLVLENPSGIYKIDSGEVFKTSF